MGRREAERRRLTVLSTDGGTITDGSCDAGFVNIIIQDEPVPVPEPVVITPTFTG